MKKTLESQGRSVAAGEVSSHSEEKAREEPKTALTHPKGRKYGGYCPKMACGTVGGGERITKTARASRGQESKWEIPVYINAFVDARYHTRDGHNPTWL